MTSCRYLNLWCRLNGLYVVGTFHLTTKIITPFMVLHCGVEQTLLILPEHLSSLGLWGLCSGAPEFPWFVGFVFRNT